MGYKKGPVGHMKASTGNKAVGFMTEGSVAYMSALHQTDPKDGVVVVGQDKSISSEDARQARINARNKKIALEKERRKIDAANKREELMFKQEEKKAAAAAKKQRAEQKMKEKQGRIPEDSEDTSTNYMRGPLNQNDPKDGGTTKMKDLPLGSKARYDEYNKRGWMQDETSLVPRTENLPRQTDLRKSSNFSNVLDRNRVPIDTKEYDRRKALNNPDISMTDLFTTHSTMVPQNKRVKLPKNMGYSRVQQKINVFNK